MTENELVIRVAMVMRHALVPDALHMTILPTDGPLMRAARAVVESGLLVPAVSLERE